MRTLQEICGTILAWRYLCAEYQKTVTRNYSAVTDRTVLYGTAIYNSFVYGRNYGRNLVEMYGRNLLS